MKKTKSKKSGIKGTKAEQPRERGMAPGIGVSAVLGILFGNFVLGPAVGFQTTGFIPGMPMSAAIGLVSGLSLSSGQSHKTVNKEEKENGRKY